MNDFNARPEVSPAASRNVENGWSGRAFGSTPWRQISALNEPVCFAVGSGRAGQARARQSGLYIASSEPAFRPEELPEVVNVADDSCNRGGSRSAARIRAARQS